MEPTFFLFPLIAISSPFLSFFAGVWLADRGHLYPHIPRRTLVPDCDPHRTRHPGSARRQRRCDDRGKYLLRIHAERIQTRGVRGYGHGLRERRARAVRRFEEQGDGTRPRRARSQAAWSGNWGGRSTRRWGVRLWRLKGHDGLHRPCRPRRPERAYMVILKDIT